MSTLGVSWSLRCLKSLLWQNWKMKVPTEFLKKKLQKVFGLWTGKTWNCQSISPLPTVSHPFPCVSCKPCTIVALHIFRIITEHVSRTSSSILGLGALSPHTPEGGKKLPPSLLDCTPQQEGPCVLSSMLAAGWGRVWQSPPSLLSARMHWDRKLVPTLFVYRLPDESGPELPTSRW